MKYIDEFRDGELVSGLAAIIARETWPERRVAIGSRTGATCYTYGRYQS